MAATEEKLWLENIQLRQYADQIEALKAKVAELQKRLFGRKRERGRFLGGVSGQTWTLPWSWLTAWNLGGMVAGPAPPCPRRRWWSRSLRSNGVGRRTETCRFLGSLMVDRFASYKFLAVALRLAICWRTCGGTGLGRPLDAGGADGSLREAIDLLTNRITCEAGIAVVVAIASAIKKTAVPPGLVILGDLSIQGNIKAVNSLVEPLQVAMENGAKRALIPLENKRNFLDVSGDIVAKVDPVLFRPTDRRAEGAGVDVTFRDYAA